jgi:hypothetical protein
MGFFRRKTSKQTSRVKKLLKLALARLVTARRPRLARKSMSCGDVGQLLALGYLERALNHVRTYAMISEHTTIVGPYFSNEGLTDSVAWIFLVQAEHVIVEDHMLQAFDMVELYCKRLIEHATQLDKPQ